MFASTCSCFCRTRSSCGQSRKATAWPAELERLAEQIIQITNENVQQAMATLAAELGPADTRVDLQVDTLKYDVGVFALGALGTGIFLFVNTFVGGLLTLAAPIIAVLIHSRMADEIKRQAKHQAEPGGADGCAGDLAALSANRG
jgi:hypothetical protein